MMKSSRPVGFIDSGIGGSTVLPQAIRLPFCRMKIMFISAILPIAHMAIKATKQLLKDAMKLYLCL